MSVKTEVVLETPVARLVELTREQAKQLGGPEIEALAGMSPQEAAPARAGYALRLVEARLFEPARQPVPELARRLRELIEGRAGEGDAIRTLSAELAASEPLERPDPHDEHAVTWRVPGPGGHVRHYVARELIGAVAPELKRALVYGFLVRCCEEALGRGTPSAQALPQPASSAKAISRAK